KEAIKIIEETIKNYERLVPKISIDLKVLDIVEPFVANRKSILMNALSKAIKDVMGIQPTFLRKTGTGDMNLYGRIKKMPVATYGPGNSRLSHTKNEYIEIKDYLKAIRIYEKTIVYLFNKK
ncbi:TPA: M20/M25/M40 family metallo-hydrolase, partial [Candidatus Bathyarchaeota archaeon]|nr:M20/M25/M40 family metallo-hydrolase [Candidatus Bathyarchaeota archaeon]